MKSGVFFERDGLLTRVRLERQHQISPRTLDDFEINQEAIVPVQKLKAAGLVLIATTNQPGLSRGYQSRRELDQMHALLKTAFQLDDILVCPHDENDRCPCRKPKPGLLLEASFKWHLDSDRSYVVSEKWQDAEAAHLAGCTSLLVKSPWNGPGHHDFILASLPAVVARILQLNAAQYPALKYSAS
jgi:D-glycero-D-manno-heptose 1,7-bisphosphate phosphatase